MKLASLAGHIDELVEITERNDQPTDRLVAGFFRRRKYLGSHDRRFISRTVFGIVRFRRRLNTLLRQYLSEHSFGPVTPKSRSALQFLAYAITMEEYNPQQTIDLLQDRWHTVVPDVELPHAAYWMSRNRSLGFLHGDDIQQLADWYSFEDWMVSEWVSQLGQDDAEDLLHALNSEAPTTLRVNTLKTSVEACQERLHSEGIETTRAQHSSQALIASRRFNQQSSPCFKDGWFEIQDEGSQIVCLLAEPMPGTRVIDACAGAGGKTLMMADLMKNRGEIMVFDAQPKRLKELEKRAVRAGLTIVATQSMATLHPGDLLGKADLLLIDAPCSGVGTIRRNPSLKWSVTPSLVDQYAERQAEILDTNAAFVRRGGRLVYATCSLLRKENEEIVEKFLSGRSDFELITPTDGLTRLGVKPDQSGYVRLFPHRHNTDGFFVAVLEREK